MLEESKALWLLQEPFPARGLWGLSEGSVLLGWIHPPGFCFLEGLSGRIRSKCAGELVKECSSGVFAFGMGHIGFLWGLLQIDWEQTDLLLQLRT